MGKISCGRVDCSKYAKHITDCCHERVCSKHHQMYTCYYGNDDTDAEFCIGDEEFCIVCINCGNGYLCNKCGKYFCDGHNTEKYVCDCE